MRTLANTPGARTRPAAQALVVVGALGVVFGDIGTSPIYTIQTVFSPSDPHRVAVSTDSVYGIISLIFWSVTIIVTPTYVTLIMRADNDGEGGIMALITLISRQGCSRRSASGDSASRAGDLRRVAVLRRQHDHTRTNHTSFERQAERPTASRDLPAGT